MEATEGYFGERIAATYDEDSASMFDPALVGLAVDRLAEFAGNGRALEHRWAGWGREPFTGLSPAHVSVYQKP